MVLDPANKKNTALPLKVLISESTFSKNSAQSQSVIMVKENAELEVESSEFSENFSFDKGGVIRGDYTWTKTTIRNSTFSRNGAFLGGVFAVLSQSTLQCLNCQILNNFAVTGAVAYSGIHGTFSLRNSTVADNLAVSVKLAEFFDAKNGHQQILNSSISGNLLVSEASLVEEAQGQVGCRQFCFFSAQFTQFLLANLDAFPDSVSPVLFKVTQAEIKIGEGTRVSQEQALLESSSS